jgi:capsular exopolysaccharide synthesis family protein
VSKFFKALEQAERDRALGEPPVAARPETAPRARPAAPADPADASAPAPAGPPAGPPSPRRRDTTPAREPAAPAPLGIDPHLVSLLEPGAMQAEPYRALRHLVETRRQLAGLGVLVVTSPGAGDGKTTTAINLAGALAQDPKARVLLVDGDFRNPALAGRLGLHVAGRRDLIDAILEPRTALDAVVQPCPPFNLDVLPTGRHQGVPYELLASPRFAELLDEARGRYAYVLIDSPPLVPFPDGRLLSGAVDGYLLVVAASRTPRKLVEEALALLDPAKLVGLVFNGDERPMTRYYYYPDRRAAARAASANGHARRGWLAGVLPRRRARGPRA